MYIITNLTTGETATYSGKELSGGLPVTLEGNSNTLLLTVTAQGR
jgi:hypothetical protein